MSGVDIKLNECARGVSEGASRVDIVVHQTNQILLDRVREGMTWGVPGMGK